MIWQLPHSQRTTRFAEALVSAAQARHIEDRRESVHRIAAMDPRRVTEIVLALAELAAHSMQPPAPTEDQAILKALRAAHAAYHRGFRLDWVVDGERQYQREKKRRHRQLQREILAEQQQADEAHRQSRAG